MSNRWSTFEIVLAFCASTMVCFILLPLAATLLSSTPQTLWLTLLDPEVYRAIGRTFLAAVLAVVLGFLSGVPLAYLLARRQFRGRAALRALVNLPIIIPHTAAGVALLLVFGRRGLLGEWLEPLGIVFSDHLAGIVVAMLFVGLPFLVNASREAFATVEEEYIQAALADGASPWQAFWHVTLPLASSGVMSGAVMMWARGVSEFGAVVILAYNPKIVPVLLYERFEGFGLAAALPVAVLLIVVSLIVFGLLNLVLWPRSRMP